LPAVAASQSDVWQSGNLVSDMLHELVIYQKHYDLMLYAFPIINRFPKNQRFVLGQQIQCSMVEIAKLIVQANAERNKSRTLWQIDMELEKLRLLTRLAKDLSIMQVKQYGLQRVTGYKRLFYADQRISDTKLSEAAYTQMKADIAFPVTVEF
jgi:hypothetical protein